MQLSTSRVLVTLGVVSLLVGCGDDESPGNAASDSASTTGGETNTTPSSDPSATMSETSPGTASQSGGSSDETGGPTDGTDAGTTGTSDPQTDGTTGEDTDGTTGGTDDGTGSGSSSEDGGEEGGETTGEVEVCEAPGELMPCDADTDDPFQAMGLGCVSGDPNTYIPIANEIMSSPDADAWKVASQFGTHINMGTGLPQWGPREGDAFLLISTGLLPDPDPMRVITQAEGVTETGTATANPDGVGAGALPAPFSPLEGSNNGAGGTPFINCDGVNDCSDSLWGQWTDGGSAANDMLWFQFQAPVPGGTHGFSFDFVYFSAEFPEYVDTTFNDVFAVWSASETYVGNLCFINDEPCTVTALANGGAVSYDGDADAELDGTGFDGYDLFDDAGWGQSTDWYNAKGSAEPGEDLLLTFILFDMGDTAYDTAVILDNFQWDCEGCTPSEIDPCIGIDPI